jgi:outer membrane protein assembly factor BamB
MSNAVKCPKCERVVSFGVSESIARCSQCGSMVDVGAGSTPVRRGSEARVLRFSLLFLLAGFVALGVARRGRRRSPPQESPTPIYTAPPVLTPAPTPAGVISWEPSSRSPVPVAINDDGIEDFVGFFRVWDGGSAWVPHVGAFDGSSLRLLWKSEPITPRFIKAVGVLPIAVVVGRSVVVGDASSTLRVFELQSGEKISTLSLPGPVMDACAVAGGRVWVKVAGGPDLAVDVVTGKSDPAARPSSCPVPEYQRGLDPVPKKLGRLRAVDAGSDMSACPSAFQNRVMARAVCRPPTVSHDEAFVPAYDLDDGIVRISVGKKAEAPTARGSGWEGSLLASGSVGKSGIPLVSDLTEGRLLAVSEPEHAAAHLVALDPHTGDRRWDIVLPQSEPGGARGAAEALVATATRVYVVRAGGSLDVYDASTGTAVGSIGTQ